MHEAHIHEYAETHGSPGSRRDGERRTLTVVVLTAVMMVVELVVGVMSGSMALLADGVHMGTHVGALGLSVAAYWYARTRAHHEAFSFGTGKVYALGGYTSAICLVIAALWMGVEAVMRFITPTNIRVEEALPVAVLGLVVNLASAKLLGHGHDHAERAPVVEENRSENESGHGHGHGPEHEHEHDHAHAPAEARVHVHDHNLRAAYFHVLADAVTSVMAIVALLGARYLGATFLDPLMGVVGALVVVHWGIKLSLSAARQLLDVSPSLVLSRAIREQLEALDDVRVADLHLWDLGPGQRGCIVKIVTSKPRDTTFYRDLIKARVPVSHLTVEVHHCTLEHGAAA